MREEILNIPTPYGDPVVLYKNHWGPADGESLSIVSGLQGNRLNGLMVASRLSQFLNAVENGEISGYKIRGHIQIFPIVNYKAWETGNMVWHFDSQDTDLTFPGMETGELTETICNTIIRHTADSDFGIILQTGEPNYEEAPHVKLIRSNRKHRNMARSFGQAIGRECATHPAIVLNLAWQWAEIGLHSFILSAGRPNSYQPQFCDLMFEGLLGFLTDQGFLEHQGEKGIPEKTTFFRAEDEQPVLIRQAGLFYPELSAGSPVKKGQKIGEIRDLYQGKLLEEVTATENGIVGTLRINPLVHEGECLAIVLKDSQKRWFRPFG